VQYIDKLHAIFHLMLMNWDNVNYYYNQEQHEIIIHSFKLLKDTTSSSVSQINLSLVIVM